MEDNQIRHHISIHFAHNNDAISVRKDALSADRKGRYLCGVASGLAEDLHGEHCTENCIASLTRQADQGDILLFADQHGIKESEDIGLLKHFEVMPNGDWYVEFRLHGEEDGIDQSSVDKANKLWAQVNGLPPYTKPRRKGFSIEGYIPQDKVLEDKKERLGIIDDMVLEGVVVVPQPAYQDSYIHAIYKALNVTAPWKIRKDVSRRLRSSLIRKDAVGAYDRERYEIENARDELIGEVITKNLSNPELLKKDLRLVFDEYSDLAVELIANQPSLQGLQFPSMATPYGEEDRLRVCKSARFVLLSDLNSHLERLVENRRELLNWGR